MGGTDYRQQLENRTGQHIEDKIWQTIEVTHRFIEHAGLASKALRFFEAQVIEHISRECPGSKALRFFEAQMIEHTSRGSRGPRCLTKAQRDCFLKAWYRIHTLASSRSGSKSWDILAKLNVLEFEQMLDTMCWMMYHCPEEHQVELQISLGPLNSSLAHGFWEDEEQFFLEQDSSSKQDSSRTRHSSSKSQPCPYQDVESSITADRWYALMIHLCSVNEKVHKNQQSDQCVNRIECFWHYIAYEIYFEDQDLGEDICLGDVTSVRSKRGWG